MSSDEGAPRTGDVLAGRYRIGALIGSGGYGRVYRATDDVTGGVFAVKVIHGIDDELRARFAQEAAIAQKLESPYTVRLLDHGLSPNGMPFMVLELLDGTSVFDLLERQRTISPRVALEITAQMLDSLAEAHAMGVVHRDIKPENIFVTSRMGQPTTAKLLDFGIAKHGATRKLTMQGQVVGTPSYMAPEQTTGKAVDARTDLYAIGLLLAEMVTGRTVMDVGGPMTIMSAQAKSAPVRLGEDVRQSIVGAIVERAVKKAPAERYQSATEMLVDVRALLADVNATSIGPTRVADATVDRQPTQHGVPAHHTISAQPLGPDLSYASGSYPPLSHAPSAPIAPRAPVPTPFISPPPRAKKRKGGSLGLPLAIVAVAALLSIVIVVVATSSRSDSHTRRSDPSPRQVEDDDTDDLHSKARRARTSDIAEIRRILLGAGYTLSVDHGGPAIHSFAPLKLPCAGSVTIMPMADEATARSTANRIAALDTQGVSYLFEGRNMVTVGIGRSGSGVDAACTAPVVALLAK